MFDFCSIFVYIILYKDKFMKKSEQKLEEILKYLSEYTEQFGYAPSYREIANGVQLKSTNSVKNYLDILAQRGKITRSDLKSRTVEVVATKNQNVTSVPVIGQVAAGIPILAEQNIEYYIPLSNAFFGYSDHSKMYILKIKGDSMVEAGINCGDYAICYSQNVAENGDIVVAMIDDSATIKYFYKESNRIRLQPANQLYSPIYSDNVQILGKVVGILRKV